MAGYCQYIRNKEKKNLKEKNNSQINKRSQRIRKTSEAGLLSL